MIKSRAGGDDRDRQTSRAQRHVFDAYLSEVPPDVSQRYKLLRDPKFKCPGKEKEIRKIVNAFVPRRTNYSGALVPKENTIKRIIYQKSESSNQDKSKGMGRLIMIGKVHV